MDEIETNIAKWLTANGIVGDVGAAQALARALDVPGDYGTLAVTRQDAATTVIGPAGELTLTGSEDIQAMRMRLEEIISNPGRAVL